MKIIPAIDLIEGKCVRLTKGDFNVCSTYNPDPLDVAKAFADWGLTRLHLVDLDGAKGNPGANLRVLERIATYTSLRTDYSGGIRDSDAIRRAMSAGASMVAVGSVAVTSPETMAGWLDDFGADSIILSADIDRSGRIATRGWLESSDMEADQLLDRFKRNGLRQSIVTEISRDGMLCGINQDLYMGLMERHTEIGFTASGGISSVADIEQCAELNLDGVIVGKAYYEGRISLRELSRLQENLN